MIKPTKPPYAAEVCQDSCRRLSPLLSRCECLLIAVSVFATILMCGPRVSAEAPRLFRQVRVKSLAAPADTDVRAESAGLALPSRKELMRGCGSRLYETHTFELRPLSLEFANDLNDRFAKQVLLVMPEENDLNKVMDALRVDTPGVENKLQTFVVSEFLRWKAPTGSFIGRRCVLSFDNQPVDAQVMLSTSFSPTSFRTALQPGDLVEVWAWDEVRGGLNFYEWTRDGLWAFAGSSPRATDPPGLAATNECLRCHRSGAPIMKELRLPWNNWDSGESPRAYLEPGNLESWPVSNQLPNLTSASLLEPRIRTVIERFNRAKVERNVDRLPDGSQQVRHLRFLLQPLFVDQEFNLASSRTQTGHSPFEAPLMPGAAKLTIPAGFFIRHELIAGGSGLKGLQIHEAAAFRNVAEIDLVAYRQRVVARNIGFARSINAAGVPTFQNASDADFAWFTPERSFVDDHLIDRLLKSGVVSREFVAAVCQLDLLTPVFSADLKAVFMTPELIPDGLIVPATAPMDHREHPLTKHVLERIAILAPRADSPLGKLGLLLNADDPVNNLRQAATDAAARIEQDFTGANVGMALDHHFDRMLNRRLHILSDPDLQHLDETRFGSSSAGLLPVPVP